MRRGDIAHIDDAEADARRAGQLAGEQLREDLDRGGEVPAHHRAQHSGGVDGGQLKALAFAVHVFPGGALGDGLGAGIGGIVGEVAGIRPVFLGQQFRARVAPAIRDGGHRGGHHDPLHAGLLRSCQYTDRAVAGGRDQLVMVLGQVGRDGGGDVLDIVHALAGLGPARIGGEIGGADGDADILARIGAQRLVEGIGLGGRPRRAGNLVPRLDQLVDDMAGNEAGGAGDEDFGHLGCSVL